MSHKHIKVFEQFSSEEMEYATREEERSGFETETTDFVPTSAHADGEYVVTFDNAEGESTTIVLTGAYDPKYSADAMISAMDMIEDSSSDGKSYSAVGIYEESPEGDGAYELKRIMIEEA